MSLRGVGVLPVTPDIGREHCGPVSRHLRSCKVGLNGICIRLIPYTNFYLSKLDKPFNKQDCNLKLYSSGGYNANFKASANERETRASCEKGFKVQV